MHEKLGHSMDNGFISKKLNKIKIERSLKWCILGVCTWPFKKKWDLVSLAGVKYHSQTIPEMIFRHENKYFELILFPSFWSNWDSDPLSTSKWLFESQFLKDFGLVGKKMVRKGCKIAIFELWIFRLFFTKLQKEGNYFFVFYAVAIEPIEI